MHKEVNYLEQQDLVTREQAARYIACSLSKLDNLRKSGKLPAVRNGRRVYFRRQDLDALFEPLTGSESDRLRELARREAALAPKLSEERKARLAKLLS